MSTTEAIKNLSDAELEALLKQRKSDKLKKQEAEKKAYERNTNTKVVGILNQAAVLLQKLQGFKKYCHVEMEKQAEALSKYGSMRSTSKGGFSITSTDGTMRVRRRRDTEPVWDERATKAIELIKDFLSDTIKKRDTELYEILIGFLEKNQAGDLEYNKVMELLKHEDKFTDERWTEGLRLIKESYHNNLKGFGYEFQVKNEEDGKWQTLVLNFSSL